MARAERELARIPQRRELRYRDREEGRVSLVEWAELRDALRREEVQLTERIAALRREIERYQTRQRDARDRAQQLATLADDLASGDVDRQKAAYHALVDRVIVRRGSIRIELRT